MKTYDKYTFFYKGPFSQWDKSKFTIDGIQFTHAEQYMMYKKATFFGDHETAAKILEASHPRQQKALGRQVKGFVESDWNFWARDFVYQGNFAKFVQNAGHLLALYSTTGTLLVEASPTDCIWGIGRREDYEGLQDPANWRGTNWLGEVLTVLRDNLLNGVCFPLNQWTRSTKTGS